MNTKISQRQFTMLFALAFVSMNLITIPSRLSSECATDGILALLISSVMSYTAIIAIFKVFSRYPGKSFNGVIVEIFGRKLGAAVKFLYFANALYLSAYSLRLISEEVGIYMLRNYSPVVIQLVFAFLCVFLAFKGFKTTGNFAQLTLWPIFAALILVFTMSMRTINTANMLPLLQDGYVGVIKGSVSASAYLFSAILVLPMFLPMVDDFNMKKAKKDFAYVCLAAFAVHSLYYLLCIGVLGERLTSEYVFPILCVVQSTKFEKALMQRYEIILLWIVIALYFLYTSMLLRGGGMLLSGSNEKKYALRCGVFSLLAFAGALFLNEQSVGVVVLEFIDANNLTFPHNFLVGLLYFSSTVKRKMVKGSKA